MLMNSIGKTLYFVTFIHVVTRKVLVYPVKRMEEFPTLQGMAYSWRDKKGVNLKELQSKHRVEYTCNEF